MLKPKILKIEVTNRCNAQCIFCSHKYMDPTRLMDMPMETVERLLDEASASGWKPAIQFSGIGEPTLYPHLVDAVKYCREKDMISFFNTNGMLMTPDLTKKLVQAGLTWFLLSVDGRDKENYEKIRVGLNFETVRYNIQEAWKICQKSNTRMRLQHIKCNENQHDIENIKKYWQPYCHQSSIQLEVPLSLGHLKAVHSRVPPLNNSCDRLWTQLMIRVNGDIPLCCVDLTDEYIMGNIHKNKMLEIYNSSKFNEARKRLISKNDVPIVCKRVCIK